MSTRAIHSYAYLFTFAEIWSGEILRKNTLFHDERSIIQHKTAQCGEGGIRTLAPLVVKREFCQHNGNMQKVVMHTYAPSLAV